MDGADVEHRSGPVQGPTHSRSLESVFHQVTASAFDHARCDRVSRRQVLIVLHTIEVVCEIPGNGRDFRKIFAGEFPRSGHLPHSTNDCFGVSLKDSQQAAMGVGFLMFLGRLENLGRPPHVLGHVKDVQDIDNLVVGDLSDLGEALVTSICQTDLTVEQHDHLLSVLPTIGHLIGGPTDRQRLIASVSEEAGISPSGVGSFPTTCLNMDGGRLGGFSSS